MITKLCSLAPKLPILIEYAVSPTDHVVPLFLVPRTAKSKTEFFEILAVLAKSCHAYEQSFTTVYFCNATSNLLAQLVLADFAPRKCFEEFFKLQKRFSWYSGDEFSRLIRLAKDWNRDWLIIAWFTYRITSIEKDWTKQCIVYQKKEIRYN